MSSPLNLPPMVTPWSLYPAALRFKPFLRPPPSVPPSPVLLSECLQGHCSILGQLFLTSLVSPFYLLTWPCVSPGPLTTLHNPDSFLQLAFFFFLIKKTGEETDSLWLWLTVSQEPLISWESSYTHCSPSLQTVSFTQTEDL